MRFEVSRLVCHPRVAGSVRLVERIFSEFFPVAPYLVQNLLVVTVLSTTGNKLALQLFQNGHLLLTHGLTELIGLTSGKVGQLATQKHDLLLVHGNAVSILQVLLHARNIVGDRFLSQLTVNKSRDVLHRTRTVKGVHGNNVFEHGRLQFAQVFLHTGRLELERADGIATAIEFVSEFIVDRYMVDVDLDALRVFNVGNRLLQDRER